MYTASVAMLVVYTLVLAWPSLVVVDWLADRDRIARELCVQHDLPPEMNHCNGQCHLAKELKATQAAQENAAAEPEVQVFHVNAVADPAPLVMLLRGSDREFPLWSSAELIGHSGSVDPVPRG